MKEKDLYVNFKPQQAVYYVEKDDSSYGPVISGSQLSHDYLDDFYIKKKNLEKKLREQVINKEVSPVYYYMTLQEIGTKDLASRVGVSKRRLKKHFEPKYFEKLSLEVLKKYATIFDVPLVSLIQLIVLKQEEHEKIDIEYMSTKNDCFIITKIGIKKNE